MPSIPFPRDALAVSTLLNMYAFLMLASPPMVPVVVAVALACVRA